MSPMFWWIASPAIILCYLAVTGIGRLGSGMARARSRSVSDTMLRFGVAIAVSLPAWALGLLVLGLMRPPHFAVSYSGAAPVDAGRNLLWLTFVGLGAVSGALGGVESAVALVVGAAAFLVSVAMLAAAGLPSTAAFVAEAVVALLATLIAIVHEHELLPVAVEKWRAHHV